MMLPQTAIVTGATGFIGSHLTRHLVAEGWNVHVIVRPKSKLSILDNITDRITIHDHDGTTECMFRIVETAKPAIVFHLASLFRSQHEPQEIEPMLTSNIVFGTQLVEAMTAHHIFKLINTGTSWQHFENKEYCPVCLYAATKQAFESILHYYTDATLLKAITLKLFDTYGPDDPRPKLFSFLRKSSMESEPLLMSQGEQLLDLVYIDDVVRAFMLAAERLQIGDSKQYEEYAVSSGSLIKLRDLVEFYTNIMKKHVTFEWGGRPYRFREVMMPWNKGQCLPGWEPKIQFEEGIRRMENISNV